MAMKPAVFIDKDGTLIHDLPYNVDIERIELRQGAGPALARLQDAGYALVLVSNQPGVALGLFDEAALDGVWNRLASMLARDGVVLDTIYYCPHHPLNPGHPCGCICRKPQPGLLFRAASEQGYDLNRSWLIGDILDDIEAGRRAGCRTVLLDVGSETEWHSGGIRHPHFVAPALGEAADHILAQSRLARMFNAKQPSERPVIIERSEQTVAPPRGGDGGGGPSFRFSCASRFRWAIGDMKVNAKSSLAWP